MDCDLESAVEKSLCYVENFITLAVFAYINFFIFVIAPVLLMLYIYEVFSDCCCNGKEKTE